MGYNDNGSGLYAAAWGFETKTVDGNNNTAYVSSIILKDTNTTNYKFVVSSSGNVTNTNNSYGSISDQRLKTNITDASSQWDDIKALKVRKFKLGTAADDDNFYQIGVIAQELETAGMNGLVTENIPNESQIAYDSSFGEEDAKVKEVKYSVLYMKAIKALQEAMTRIETLEAKVETLEG
jgi:predicted RNA-binding protein with PUA-like domain